MKKVNSLIIALFLSVAFIACGDSTPKNTAEELIEEVTSTDETVETETYVVNAEESQLTWAGELMGVYTHEGLISLSEGTLEFAGDQVVGGNFVVDMTTITPTDENYNEENTKENLVGHLEADDFFLVSEYPTASLVINGANGDELAATLSIRGKDNEVVIQDVVVNREEGTAQGTLIFNRQDFDVSFTHPIKDLVLSNDVKVGVTLRF